MPINCGIESGIDFNCADLRKPGGYYRAVWAFNIADLRVPINVELAEYVTSLEFLTYASLYKLESTKFAHEATWAQQNGDGGNVSYQQTVTLRLPNSDPASDKVIEDASVAELGIITRSNSGEWQIWGAENGVSAGDGTAGGNGRQGTDSTFTTLVLQGFERFLPKRLLIGGSDQATLAAINAMAV